MVKDEDDRRNVMTDGDERRTVVTDEDDGNNVSTGGDVKWWEKVRHKVVTLR